MFNLSKKKNRLEKRLWDMANSFSSRNDKFKLYFLDSYSDNEKSIVRLEFEGKKRWDKKFYASIGGVVTDSGIVAIKLLSNKANENKIYIFTVKGKQLFQFDLHRRCYDLNLSGAQNFVWINPASKDGERGKKIVILPLVKPFNPIIINDPQNDNYALKRIVDIELNNEQIIFNCNDNLTVICDYNGKVLNKNELDSVYQKIREESTDGYTLYNLAMEYLYDCSLFELQDDIRDKVINILLRANQGNMSNNTHATICKVLGEYCFKIADIENCIAWFEQAISCNPKIGLKRKLDSLKQNNSVTNHSVTDQTKKD